MQGKADTTVIHYSVRSTVTPFFVSGDVSMTKGKKWDLSKYRDFQMGSDVETIARQAGPALSAIKIICRRPALVEEAEWRPQPLGWSSSVEATKDVIFSFYNGILCRIVVDYDPYQTEGLTTDDVVEAISATYGDADRSPQGSWAGQEELLARWHDAIHGFDLTRSPYGPGFRLVGISKGPDAAARTAIAEAIRLDQQEAPQREAFRLSAEAAEAKAKLELARHTNKMKFRP